MGLYNTWSFQMFIKITIFEITPNTLNRHLDVQ